MDDKNNLISGATEATAPASCAHHAVVGGAVAGSSKAVRKCFQDWIVVTGDQSRFEHHTTTRTSPTSDIAFLAQ